MLAFCRAKPGTVCNAAAAFSLSRMKEQGTKPMKHFLPILVVAALGSLAAVKPTPAFSGDDRNVNDLESKTSQQNGVEAGTTYAEASVQMYRRLGLRGRPVANSSGNLGDAPNPMLYVLTNDPVTGAPGFGAADPASGC
jgi:hypothetical protein